MSRSADIRRKTKETNISLSLNLDGTGESAVQTGIGFFDHMLEGFAKHGFFDLAVAAEGDLAVDCHHTVEDTGIVLGNAVREALGDKKGIRRFGSCILPMDETLVLCAVDLSGRDYLSVSRVRRVVYDGAHRVSGHGDGKGIFLRGILQCRYEPAHKSTLREQSSSHY